MAITYYVKYSTGADGNSGLDSYANAKKTLKGAITAALLTADTVFYVRMFAETHTWAAGEETAISSTSNGKTFYIIGEDRDTTIITVAAATQTYIVAVSSNSSTIHYEFSDMTFQYDFAASATSHNDFYVQGTAGATGNYLGFDNCKFTGTSGTTYNNISTLSNYDSEVYVKDCIFNARNYCIQLGGDAGCSFTSTGSDYTSTANASAGAIFFNVTTATYASITIANNSFTVNNAVVAIYGGATTVTGTVDISNNSIDAGLQFASFTSLSNFSINYNTIELAHSAAKAITIGYDVIETAAKYGYVVSTNGEIRGNRCRRTVGTTTASGHGIMVGHKANNIEVYENYVSGFWYQLVIKSKNCNVHHNIVKGTTAGIFNNGSNNTIKHNSCYARLRAAEDGSALLFNENQASLSGVANITVTQGNNVIQLPGGTDLTLANINDDIISVTGRTDGLCGSSFFRITAKDDGLDQIIISPTPTAATQNNLSWSINQLGDNNTITNNIFDGGTGYITVSFRDPLISSYFDYNVYVQGQTYTFRMPPDASPNTANTKSELLSKWATVFTGTSAQTYDNDQNSYVLPTSSTQFSYIDTSIDYIGSDDFTPIGYALGNATPSPCLDIGAIQVTSWNCDATVEEIDTSNYISGNTNITTEELLRFKGNATNFSIVTEWRYHTYTDWQFKAENETEIFSFSSNATTGIGNIIYATKNDILIILDRTKNYYYRARVNTGNWTEWQYLDLTGEIRTITGKHRDRETIQETSRGATVIATNPLWTETKTSTGATIVNQVYSRETSRGYDETKTSSGATIVSR